MGPLISAHHARRLDEFIALGQREGAVLACGGASLEGKGFFRRPAVLVKASNTMQIAQEELFGPVVAFLRAKDAKEAMTLANDTRYGLAATLWSQDTSRAMQLAGDFRAGNIGVNTPYIRDIRCPFGGMKQSGLGTLGGVWSLEQFTQLRTMSIPIANSELPRYGLSIS